MLARYMLSPCARLSFRPSVTRRYCTKTAKHRITQTTPYDISWTLVFWRQRSQRNSNGVTPTPLPIPQRGRHANRGGVGSNQRFSTNISLYLKNDARYGHGYYGIRIGTRMRCIEWRYFQWPWVTLNYPSHPLFDILHLLAYPCSG